MKYIVYILRSKTDNKRYIGCTSNLTRRISEHKEGKVKSTRHRRPFELIYTEEFETKSEAASREKYFKTHQGRNYLDSIDK